MIGIKVHSSLPLRKGTRDCVVSTQSVCAAGTSEPVLILKVLMCTLLNINSQTPSDLRQGQSTCTIHCDFADSYLLEIPVSWRFWREGWMCNKTLQKLRGTNPGMRISSGLSSVKL